MLTPIEHDEVIPATVRRFLDSQRVPMVHGTRPGPISQVDDDGLLFIGSYESRAQAAARNIREVIALVTDDEYGTGDDWHTFDRDDAEERLIAETHVPLEDVGNGDGDLLPILRRAVPMIERSIALRRPVLVHCMAGVSRSAAVVIAYLMRRDRLPFYSAFVQLASVRGTVNPNVGFRRQLEDWDPASLDVAPSLFERLMDYLM